MLISRMRLLLICSPATFAWSFLAHELIAQVAEPLLTERAAAEVKDILGGTQRLQDIAAWADIVKGQPQYRYTSALHYINFKGDEPPEHCAFDYSPPNLAAWPEWVHEKEHVNVLDAVANFTLQLVHADRGSWRRSEALRLLVHFVEDLHQPLHLSGKLRGGNDKPVVYNGYRSNLHRVWDGLVVTRRMREIHDGRIAHAENVEGSTELGAEPLHHDFLRKRSTAAPGDETDPIREAYVAHLRGLLNMTTTEGSAAQKVYNEWLSCPTTSQQTREATTWLDSFMSWMTGIRATQVSTEWSSSDLSSRYGCPEHWARGVAHLNCDTVWAFDDRQTDGQPGSAVDALGNGNRRRGPGRGRKPPRPRPPPYTDLPRLGNAYAGRIAAGDLGEGVFFGLERANGAGDGVVGPQRLHLIDSLVLRAAVRLAAVLNAVLDGDDQ
ncbi:hypothetical protein PYCC9005_004554 [Savitreella phatthalungensis]